jgi:hypothetical protein
VDTQLTPGERAAHCAEQALLLASVSVTAVAGYRSVAGRRWRRAKTMAGPAWLFVAAWTALAGYVFVGKLLSGGGTDNPAFLIIFVAVLVWVLCGVVTWVAGMVALALWEGLVWFGRSDQELTANRRGRWISAEECRANKAHLEAGLASYGPNLVMSGLLAAVGDGGYLLGSDLAGAYLNFAQPWLAWNQAETQLLAGQGVWICDPPPPGQAASVVVPYVALGVIADVVALWIGCRIDAPPPIPAIVTITLGLLAIVAFRRRIRAAILSRR